MGFSIHLQISVTETVNEEAQTQQVAYRLILSWEAKGSLGLDSRSGQGLGVFGRDIHQLGIGVSFRAKSCL